MNYDDGPATGMSLKLYAAACSYRARALRYTTSAYSRRRRTQYFIISPGLRQRSATRHIGKQPQQLGCRWHRTRWPEWCVRLHVPPVLPMLRQQLHCCQFANVSPTSWWSSHTRHDILAPSLTYLTSFTTIY